MTIMIGGACASDTSAATSEPVIFADQLQATAQAAPRGEAAAVSSTAIAEPVETPTPAPAEPAEPTIEPTTAPTATPGLLPCSDATDILNLWLQSPAEPIVREANRFPTDLWVCDDLAIVSQELECLPLKTDRMYTMYVDIYGDEFEELLTSNTIFCVAGDVTRLDPANQ